MIANARVSKSNRRTAVAGLAAAAAVASVLLAGAQPAAADSRIGATEGNIIAEAAAAGGISSQPLGLAVSQKEGGDVYLADGGNGRIDQFAPNGNWVRAFGGGVVPGAATATGDLTAGSPTVDNAALTSGRLLRGDVVTGVGIPAGTLVLFVTPNEIELTKPAEISASGDTLSAAAGPGNVPTNEVQKLAVSATAGGFTLSFTSPEPGSTTDTTPGGRLTAVTTAGSPTVTSVAALTGTGTLASGSKTVTALTHEASFSAGQAISGAGIPAGATITAVGSGTLTLSANATASGEGIPLSATPTGTGTLSSGSKTVTALTDGAAFSAGQTISGAGIPAGATITAVGSGTLTLSANATASATKVALSARPTLVAGQTVSGPGIPAGTTIASVAQNGEELTLSADATASASTVALAVGIPFDLDAAELQSALEALPNVGSGAVSVSGGPGDEKGEHPYLIEFTGKYADTNVNQVSATALGLAGGSPSSQATVATVTQGAGALETCTAACVGGEGGVGAGQLDESDEIAVDNDPSSGSYGDVYVVDQRNFRIEKFDPEGRFLLMLGGQVNKTKVAEGKPAAEQNLCTEEEIEVEHDLCGAGVPGTGSSYFFRSGSLEWSQLRDNSIAVGPDGTVYVGDYGRIQEFEPDGAFAGELKLEDPEKQFVTALALDAAGDLFERSAVYANGGLHSQIPGVREYGPGPAHALIRTFDAEEANSEPKHIAVDAAGDLIVSDSHAVTPPPSCGIHQNFETCPEAAFRLFKPAGGLAAEFTSPEVSVNSGQFSPPNGIAVGAGGSLYASSSSKPGQGSPREEDYIAVLGLPQPGPPRVSELHVTDLEPRTATLHAVVNPEQLDSHYRFQWIAQRRYAEDGNSYGAGTESSALVDLGAIGKDYPVQTAVSGLTPGAAYRYRVVATNAEGEAKPEATFETLQPVSIRGLATQTVGPELATLKAELDPNGSATRWVLRYGTEADNYSAGSAEGNLPVGSEFVKLEREGKEGITFTGLRPAATYHYQLVAENEDGVVETADASFTTEPSAAEEHEAELRECPNVTLREENSSTALPDCRAYEQVSEVDKEGGEAYPGISLSPAGNRVLYSSNGIFAGVEQDEVTASYLAERTPSGWMTRPVIGKVGAPPDTQPVMLLGGLLFTPEMDRWLIGELPGQLDNFGFNNKDVTSAYLTMGFANGSYVLHASPTLALLEGERRPFNEFLSDGHVMVQAASEDLSRIYLVNNSRLLPNPADPRPDSYTPGNTAAAGSDRIYELSGLGGPSPAIKLVAELPPGLKSEMECAIDRDGGNGAGIQNSSARLASSDGATFVYSAPIERQAGGQCGEGTLNPVALFAIVAEGAPFQLNTPPPSQCHAPSPCASAPPTGPLFDGLSPDGRYAWFTTAQPLIDSDTDQTGDLYLAKLEGGHVAELVQASAGEASPDHPTPGQGAGVQGVVRVSPDGSHAAFVASGVLTTEPNSAGDSAEPGADNLYVYDAESGETKFVARLCSPQGRSGVVPDPACPAREGGDGGLWQNVGTSVSSPAEFTPSGRYLLFQSVGRLAPGDTDNVSDLYRYDFATGALIRVTAGRDGNDANGNDDAFPVELRPPAEQNNANEPAEDSSRAISADGSTVIFETAAPLVSGDTNGANDVYEWEEQGHGGCHEAGGCVRLVSDGVDPHGASYGIISASGEGIAFQTQRGEVPADTDGVGDIYEARVDGGFHFTPPSEICKAKTADGCHGPATAEGLRPSYTSQEFVGPGNGPAQLSCAKGKVRVSKHGQVRCVAKRHRRKRHGAKRGRAANANHGGAK